MCVHQKREAAIIGKAAKAVSSKTTHSQSEMELEHKLNINTSWIFLIGYHGYTMHFAKSTEIATPSC